MKSTFYLGRSTLKPKDFLSASSLSNSPSIQLDRDARERVVKCRGYVDQILKSDAPVYGINTGVGLLANVLVSKKDAKELSLNIVRSHCAGVGEPLSLRESRLLLLLRAHTLAIGYSGVRPEVIETMVSFLNEGITPVVPAEGSVGASGDLAPLAHLALTLVGEGEVYYQKQRLKTSVVLNQLKLRPLELEAREGLALINGTQLMTTYLLTQLARLSRITRVADIVAACSLEAIRGSLAPFDPRLHKLRPHPGQLAVADNMRRLTADSKIMESHKDCGKVQDSYSFRCIPQVHGAARDYIAMVHDVLYRELHSVTDNPILIPEDQHVLSGGNFHGAPLALGLDLLAIASSQLGSISERRIEKLTNPVFSDLPAFLVKSPGLNSGVMMAQVTAAALASENKLLSHPASVDTIPTSADKEDHVSMGPISGRKLKKVLLNVERILSIEAMCARQGLWLLEPLQPGTGVRQAYRRFSNVMPPLEKDRVISEDIAHLHHLLFRTPFVDEVKQDIGDIY